MKALILAAGLGTRLLPHTSRRPKPLFTLAGKSLLERAVERLIKVGCSHIIINTHHLHRQISTLIRQQDYPVPVETRYEPLLLDTGGAVKNVQDVVGTDDFWVVNADVVTDLDLEPVWRNHRTGDRLATLVVHDEPRFNGVRVNDQGFVTGIPGTAPPPSFCPPGQRLLAFTGIQILSPAIFDHMPADKVFSSIDVYKSLCNGKNRIKAWVATDFYWEDTGTPETYLDAGLRQLFPGIRSDNTEKKQRIPAEEILITPLAGDGSDRRWYRLHHEATTTVVADHGIQADETAPTPREIDAFIHIGRHLGNKHLPVPEIMAYDLFSGLVMVSDLGDTHLQHRIEEARSAEEIYTWYRRACALAVDFSFSGQEGFDTAWTYQTQSYDKTLILEKECRYFTDAFLKEYLGMSIPFASLLPAFSHIADQCLTHAVTGLMHRDFQSRNIMVADDDRLWVIDFQGARMGPLQYDVASLLIDPYVRLDRAMKENLLDFCARTVEHRTGFNSEQFKKGYRFCAITRNLQILGAFSHLSRHRGKVWFERYIPPALETLGAALEAVDIPDGDHLKAAVAVARSRLGLLLSEKPNLES